MVNDLQSNFKKKNFFLLLKAKHCNEPEELDQLKRNSSSIKLINPDCNVSISTGHQLTSAIDNQRLYISKLTKGNVTNKREKPVNAIDLFRGQVVCLFPALISQINLVVNQSMIPTERPLTTGQTYNIQN